MSATGKDERIAGPDDELQIFENDPLASNTGQVVSPESVHDSRNIAPEVAMQRKSRRSCDRRLEEGSSVSAGRTFWGERPGGYRCIWDWNCGPARAQMWRDYDLLAMKPYRSDIRVFRTASACPEGLPPHGMPNGRR